MSTNACFAFSELYYLKNTQGMTVHNFVSENYSKYNFRVTKQNPYYGVSTKDNDEYAVVILQQSGNNMFYYYQNYHHLYIHYPYI